MRIKSKLINGSGEILDVVYFDVENESEINGKEIHHVHAFCFYNNKIVIVHNKDNDHWNLPGGSVESSESFRDATIREIQEETNMKVLSLKLLGYQEIYQDGKIICQTRSVCIVEPYGEFESDPDGDIDTIKFVDPKDLMLSMGWKIREIGDYLLVMACEEKEKF